LLLVSSGFLTTPPPPSPTLFPYTTLFRSKAASHAAPLARRQRPRLGLGGPPGAHAGRPLRCATRKLIQSEVRACVVKPGISSLRSEEHTSELQSLAYLVCRLLLEKKKKQI